MQEREPFLQLIGLVLIPIPRDKVEKCVARKGCGISS